jgi:ATP-dependent DNA helicase RecQ
VRLVKELLIQKKISYEMHRAGKSISEIAAERGLGITTIESHLSYYVAAGELDVNEFVSRDRQDMIEASVARYGKLSLKLLKDNLPDTISYCEIKMMVSHLAFSGR